MKRVALLHSGRCGSMIMYSMLSQNPSIQWTDPIEPLTTVGDKAYNKDTIDSVVNPRMEKDILMGSFIFDQFFKIEYFGLWPDHYDILRKFGFNEFIILRRNALRIIASYTIALTKNIWHEPVLVDDDFSIRISTKDLLHKIKVIEYRYQTSIELTKGLVLDYENDIHKNPMAAYEKICDYVGAEAYTPSINLHKIFADWPLNRLIGNFDEVSRILNNTKYNNLLNDG